MSEQPPTDGPAIGEPAIDIGTTTAAGAGVDDREFASEVGEQTSSDLAVEGAFERESSGASTDGAAADVGADDLT